MRIAYVCTDPGIPVFGSKGASIHAQAVLRELFRAGHELHLLTPRPGGEPQVPIAVHQLPVVGGGPAAERERAAQRSDQAVAAVLDELSPDLVYERYALWGRTATAWAARTGIPSLLEVNAPLVAEQLRFRELVDVDRAHAVSRAALGAASAVVCVSDAVADWARTVSRRPDRVFVIPNGVDAERIRPSRAPVTPATGPPFTVGFVGTLKAWHGVETLLAAFAQTGGRRRRLAPAGGRRRSVALHTGGPGGAVGRVMPGRVHRNAAAGLGAGPPAAHGRRLRTLRP